MIDVHTLIAEEIEKFRKEYRKAYAGILPDEVLEKGNPWFENFLTEFALSISKKTAEVGRVEKVKEEYLNLYRADDPSVIIGEEHNAIAAAQEEAYKEFFKEK